MKVVLLYALLFLGAFGGFFLLKAVMDTDYPIMVVVSNSMEPALGVGDYIFVQGLGDATSLNAGPSGDIIVFPRPGSSHGEYIVHRVVRRIVRGSQVYYNTKGDNNLSQDPWEVPSLSVLGKVYARTPFLGYFSLFERTSGGIVMLISLVCLVFLIDYVVPKTGVEDHTAFLGGRRRLFQGIVAVLVFVSGLPFVFSFGLTGFLFASEVIAIGAWYCGCVVFGAAIQDEDSSLVLWLYQLVLVTLPVASDLIYRVTRIMPRDWWSDSRGTVPLTWLLQGETSSYYGYLLWLAVVVLPGCAIYLGSLVMKRRGVDVSGILMGWVHGASTHGQLGKTYP